MNKKEAIHFLKEALSEIPTLAKLHYDNQDYPLWHNQIEDVLEAIFGRDSREYQRFAEAHPTRPRTSSTDRSAETQWYLDELKMRETAILSIIKKYENLGILEAAETTSEKATIKTEKPRAFIAHGGESPALRKLKNFLEALGVQPLVVEEQASEGRSVGENVDWYSKQGDFAIILAAKGDIDAKTGQFIPRGNVLMEIGKLQELFKGRIIYLLQSGTKFPTNISEKVWGRFSPQSMDNAFIKIARELKAFGMLKAVKP